MPRLNPHQQVKETRDLVAAYVQERLQEECKERGVAAKIAKATGFKEPTIANAKRYGKVGPDLSEALAKYWGMTHDQLKALARGEAVEESPERPPPEPTPPTPPARSHVQPRATAERDDVEVDGWLFETLQKLKKPTYSRKNGQDAKAFLLSGPNLLDRNNPEKLVLGALEAARELGAAGKPTDPDAIMAHLIEKNAPPSGPQAGARADKAAREFSQGILDKEKKLMAKEGYVPKRRRS